MNFSPNWKSVILKAMIPFLFHLRKQVGWINNNGDVITEIADLVGRGGTHL
jgi:hypothetical protein